MPRGIGQILLRALGVHVQQVEHASASQADLEIDKIGGLESLQMWAGQPLYRNGQRVSVLRDARPRMTAEVAAAPGIIGGGRAWLIFRV